jgi:hypothetical protein
MVRDEAADYIDHVVGFRKQPCQRAEHTPKWLDPKT